MRQTAKTAEVKTTLYGWWSKVHSLRSERILMDFQIYTIF